MTIENERLVDYLGLELELCYLAPDGRYFWIVVDRIRRVDDIAREMLRLFNRFTRIGKSFERIRRSEPGSSIADRRPYAACVAVRMRSHERTASCHIRIDADVRSVSEAPRYAAGAMLPPNLELGLSDPILQVLTLDAQTRTGTTRAGENGGPAEHSGHTTPGGDASRIRGSRRKAVSGQSDAAAAMTREVQSGNSRQHASQSVPVHSPSTPPTPSMTGTPSEASSSSSTSKSPK